MKWLILLAVICGPILLVGFTFWHAERQGARDRAKFIAATGKTPERAMWEVMRDSKP